MQIKNVILAAGFVGLTACGGNQKTADTPKAPEAPSVRTSDQLVMSTLWYQNSTEARYLYEQAYRLAAEMLKNNIEGVQADRRSIIVDIDETVLDNSPYEARLVQKGQSYDSKSWAEWVWEADADLLPGAEEFLRTAETMGVEVFYISNRSSDLLDPTMQNLMEHNLPFADPEHILLQGEDGSSKIGRRDQVKSVSRVLLLVGDQMTDFSETFGQEISPDEEQMIDPALMDSLQRSFVLVPNPMYGTFEKTVYPEGMDLSDEQKVEYRKRALRTKTEKKDR